MRLDSISALALINQHLESLLSYDSRTVVEALKSITEPQVAHTVHAHLGDRISRITALINAPADEHVKRLMFLKIITKITELERGIAQSRSISIGDMFDIGFSPSHFEIVQQPSRIFESPIIENEAEVESDSIL